MRFNVEHSSLPRMKDFEKFCEIDDWIERSLKKVFNFDGHKCFAPKFSRQNFRAKMFAPNFSRQNFRAKFFAPKFEKIKKIEDIRFSPHWMGEM